MQTATRLLLVTLLVLSVLSLPFAGTASAQAVVCGGDDGGDLVSPDCGSGGSDDGDDDDGDNDGGACCVDPYDRIPSAVLV